MRALTVRQPWAWAIATGHKTVENRVHGTAYRGPLAIHTSRGWSDEGAEDPNLAAAWGRHQGLSVACHPMRWPELFPEGAFVAVVDLVDVHTGRACCQPWGQTWGQLDRGPYARAVTLRHWVLDRPRPLDEPLPWRGRLGLWTPPSAATKQLAWMAGR